MISICNAGINRNTQSFGVKIPTRDVLSLATGRNFSESFDDILAAANLMTGRRNTTMGMLGIAVPCEISLLKQFPVLRRIKEEASKYFSSKERTEEDADKWIQNAIKQVGQDELDVEPLNFDREPVNTTGNIINMIEEYKGKHKNSVEK